MEEEVTIKIAQKAFAFTAKLQGEISENLW